MKIIYFWLLPALVLVAGCDRHNGDELSSELPITVSVDVQSRAGMTTDKLQELAMFVVNGNSVHYSYFNVLMLNSDDTKTFVRVDPESKAPLKMVWGDWTTPVDVIAYAPYRTNATQTALAGSVAIDQSDEKGVVESDLVCQKMSVIPSENVDANGNLAISMNHILSKLTIDLEFNVIAGGNTDHNPISGIDIEGTKTDYSFNPLEGSFVDVQNINTVTPFCSSAAVASTAGKGRAIYECILVPQSVASGTFKVNVMLYGVLYTYQLPRELVFKSNVRYTLSLKIDPRGAVTGDVTDVPWGEGWEDVLLPDVTSKVTFNKEKSIFPEHSLYNATKQAVSLSYRGGVVELVFDGAYDKTMIVSTHDDRIKIEDKLGSKYKRTHLVITATQPDQGDQYSVTINVKNALQTHDKGTDVTISVYPNKMPTVVMGGLRWMAYNGIGRSEELYPRLEIGQTVRDIYRKDWNKYSAACMWGNRVAPLKPLIFPWEVVATINTGGTAIGASVTEWADNSSSIPCPDGWRLPSKDELQRIWKSHTYWSENEYTIGGVKYTAKIENSGYPEIAVTGKAPIQPKIYTISNGTSELVFPIIGWRARDDYAGGQSLPAVDAGKSFYLWTKTKGAKSWNAHVIGMTNTGNIYNPDNVGNDNQAMTEAYNGVRCVQNL